MQSQNRRADGSLISDGINNNTYKLLFGDNKNLPKEERGSKENAIAYRTIDQFTKLQEKRLFDKLLKLIYKTNNISSVGKVVFNKDSGQYEYRNQNKVITFDKLSNHLNNQELQKELMSDKRYHQCHARAINIAPGIEDSRIVTGYITIANERILHSVIEYDENNKTVVLDWTVNLKIAKEEYVKLTEFVELSSFEASKVIDDMDKIIGNLGDIGVKSYVVFRDEIRRDMNRNPQIFGINKQEKRASSKNDKHDSEER